MNFKLSIAVKFGKFGPEWLQNLCIVILNYLVNLKFEAVEKFY